MKSSVQLVYITDRPTPTSEITDILPIRYMQFIYYIITEPIGQFGKCWMNSGRQKSQSLGNWAISCGDL